MTHLLVALLILPFTTHSLETEHFQGRREGVVLMMLHSIVIWPLTLRLYKDGMEHAGLSPELLSEGGVGVQEKQVFTGMRDDLCTRHAFAFG